LKVRGGPYLRREQMRRFGMMFGVVVLGVFVAASVAVAVTKTCHNVPCNGTGNNDVLYERIGANKRDHINGEDGRDVIDANTFNFDRDRLFGGRQGDKLLTNDTDSRDLAEGGRGRDTCFVSRGDAIRSCEVVRRGTFRSGTSNVLKDLSPEAFGQ
jgi:hypothetical protein